MQSRFFSVIFVVNTFSIRCFSFFLQVFGCFVVMKTLSCDRPQELSLLAVFSMALSLLLWIILTIKSIRKSIILHFILLFICASIMRTVFKNSQKLQEFFSHEISILWTLRNTPKIYQETIRFIQKLVDCCKIHNVVSFLKIYLLFFSVTLKLQFFHRLNLLDRLRNKLAEVMLQRG